MIDDEETISTTQALLALHGALYSLITALHRDGQLPTRILLDQMRRTALVLDEDGAYPAARMLRDQIEVLESEFARAGPSAR